jgi:DNA repair protein RecN (Recombination protein N)
MALNTLYVKNFAIIEELLVDFHHGLNILTGQTGAGKSIIIGALETLLGIKKQPANLIIRPSCDMAIIEGVFDISKSNRIKEILNTQEDELVIRKEINPNHSKSFINNRLVTSNLLREIGNWLVDIVGQSMHQRLLDNSYQLQALDDFAKLNHLKQRLSSLYTRFNKIKEELNSLKEKEELREKEIQLLTYQIKEIENSALTKGEDKELLIRKQKLQNIEKISTTCQTLWHILHSDEKGLILTFSQLLEKFKELNRLDNSSKFFSEKAQNLFYQLEDLSYKFNNYMQNVELSSPQEVTQTLNECEARLNLIDKLKNKYSCKTVEDILSYKEEAKQKLHELINYTTKIEDKEKELREVTTDLSNLAKQLSEKRQEKALILQDLINNQLKEVGFKKADFFINITQRQGNFHTEKGDFLMTKEGIDFVEFLVRTNPGMPICKLKDITSGGELSRIMLVLRNTLAEVDKLLTLIFDEIDVGISGNIAHIVGEKLKNIAKHRQIICITHLPQIAAFAEMHFHVEKIQTATGTKAVIKKLSWEERINEIANLLAGDYDTQTAKELAKELISVS